FILFYFVFSLILPPPPSFTLFPYTTLFRSLLGLATQRFVENLLGVGHIEHRRRSAARRFRHAVCVAGARTGIKVRHELRLGDLRDRKSTRLNSSHDQISYAVFCLKKKKQKI